ncbi:MAG: hypothetical protein ACP5DX_01145 [Paracoccaceae bacterium]
MKRLAPLLLAAAPLHAEPPEITAAEATEMAGTWRIDVTLRHPDAGWDHYADGWEVLAPDGTRLGYRELAHPHVDEQPFTRSLSAIAIPETVRQVTIRAHCSRDGWSGDSLTIPLPRAE